MLTYVRTHNIKFAPELPNTVEIDITAILPKRSPLSFGAKFDGTDDTDGINKAIASLGSSGYSVISLPEGCVATILGTVLIPSGVKLDLNGAIVNGSGSNVMFEGGKWSGGSIVSSFGDAPDVTLTTDAWVGNGLIQNCMSAVRVNNWVAGCRVHNIRGYHVNQLVHTKRSFYCEFSNLLAWEPLDKNALPCFHWDSAVQAMGINRCYAIGYKVGHQVQGNGDMEMMSTCSAEGCDTGIYITGTANLGGGITGLILRNCYLENNGTAIKADNAFTTENLDIDNCFFNECYVILDGQQILSGKFGKNNKIKVSANRPGNFNMLGNAVGSKGFTIELEDITKAGNSLAPTIDTTNRFFIGGNVKMSRVVTLTDANGFVYARNLEEVNVPVSKCSGIEFGTIPQNTVPFCETFYSNGVLNVKTQILYSDFMMAVYNIGIFDNTGGPYWVRGHIFGDTVSPATTGQKTVTLQNNGGFLQLNISAFTGAATYRGFVKVK